MVTSEESNRQRERDFVKWLDAIKADADAIFLLGDIFDFWFEYRHVVPRGFVRLLGKLAELTDSGISVYFFTGNHDQWMRNYLTDELNVKVFHKPTEFVINGKIFLIGHGHDISFKSLKERTLNVIFGNPLLRKLYAAIHPRWGITFGKNWSIRSRKRKGRIVDPFDGMEKEMIYLHVQKLLCRKHYDYFVFGHRHLATDTPLNEKSRYINTGEWIKEQTYAVFDGNDLRIIGSCLK